MKRAKKFCPLFSYKVASPTVASPKEHVFEQITYNPAFTERNIQEANAYLLDSRPEQKSLVTYHTLPSLCVCVWLVNTLTSTAPIEPPIICMWCPADICEQWERNLSFGLADVSGAGTRDESLRTSAWEATGARAYRSDSVRRLLLVMRFLITKVTTSSLLRVVLVAA